MTEHAPQSSAEDDLGPLPETPEATGIAEVDAVITEVAQVAQRPVDEHVDVYGTAHDRLRTALDTPPADPPTA